LQGDKNKVIGFVDDSANLIGSSIHGCKVFAPSQIEKLVIQHNIKIIVLAMPSLNGGAKRSIINNLIKLPVRVITVPTLEEILGGSALVSNTQDIEIEDILGRDIVPPNAQLLCARISNKTILVTGAGGSIGSEICLQISQLDAKLLILLDVSESALFEIEQMLINITDIKLKCVLGSVLDNALLHKTFQKYDIDTVFHAAAYKHVPMVESNPCAGVYNNIIGTYNVAKQAKLNKVESFVLISTDKAVRPSNIMGATKRFSELILQMFNNEKECSTIFTMVRFGNVLDSGGSVLPLFRKQINDGGPLTVTHRDIIRYFMSIPEAVQLVIQAGAMAEGGDVFILDMGNPVNIFEMAKKMIYLSGLTPMDKNNKNGDIAIKITGLRPGEKLYEELLIGKDSIITEHPRIMKAREVQISNKLVEEGINEFSIACKTQDTKKIKILLSKYVHEYKAVEL